MADVTGCQFASYVFGSTGGSVIYVSLTNHVSDLQGDHGIEGPDRHVMIRQVSKACTHFNN